MKQLKKSYDAIIAEYILLFKAHMGWSSMESECNDGVLMIGERYFFSLDNIRYVMDNDVAADTVLDWYDYTERLLSLGHLPLPNLSSWCAGCPRLSEEEISKMERCRDAGYYGNNQCN